MKVGNVGRNIARLRQINGVAQRELADEIGVSVSAVSNWENGHSQPKLGRIVTMARFFHVPPSVLIEEDGVRRVDPVTRRLRCDDDEMVDDVLSVLDERGPYGAGPYGASVIRATAPLYGSISAGTPRETIAADEQVPVPDPVISTHPNGFFLRVSGECMNRVLPGGAYAFVDPDAEVCAGDVAAVIVNGNEATIKRYHRTANSVILAPDSHDPSFKDQVFDYSQADVEEVRLIGRVVWYAMPFGGRL